MRWTAWSTVAAILLGLALAGGTARAEEPSPSMLLGHVPRVMLAVKLSYTRGKGAERCPDERSARFRFLLHSHYDPFEQGSDRYPAGALRLAVTGTANRLTGTYTYVDENGETLRTLSRTLDGTGPRDCDWLLDFLATGVAVDFFMRELSLAEKLGRAPRSKAETVEPPAPTPCPEYPFSVWPPEGPMAPLRPPKPDPPKPLERWPFAVRVGVAAWPELIVSGLGTFGFSAEAGARYHAFSLDVEVHGDPPLGSVTFPGFGAVSFGRVSAALLACGHYGWFAGCAVGDVGRFLFPDHVRNLPPSARYDAAGVRVGMEFPVAPPRLFLTTTLDLRAPIDPATYTAARVTAFSPVGLSVGLGLGVLLELSP